MTECLVLKMLCNNKLVIASFIYRSPSQSSQEFAQFEMPFSQLLNGVASKSPPDEHTRGKCFSTQILKDMRMN